jgi:hypothetical protein
LLGKQLKLFGGEEVAVDGSFFKGDASKDSIYTAKKTGSTTGCTRKENRGLPATTGRQNHPAKRLVGFPVQFLEKLEKLERLVVAMLGLTLANHCSRLHIERGEQGCGTVALVVMRHRSILARFHGQTRLAAIQGLDLAFLIDRKHQGLRRWIQIQANDIAPLFSEQGIARYLESLYLMQLQLVLPPDAEDCHPGNRRASVRQRK